MGRHIREEIAKRAAKEIQPGSIVNLGIGIPSLVPAYLENGQGIMIQAENGVLGMGPPPPHGMEDEHLCNAAGYPVTAVKGASYFDTATAFGMIRRGRIDVTILGSLQVSGTGDLANWIVPGKKVPGMGGAMELAQKAKKVIVVMSHTTSKGEPKIVSRCTIPVTASSCVNMVITEMAVFKIEDQRLFLIEKMGDSTLNEIVTATEAPVYQWESKERLTP